MKVFESYLQLCSEIECYSIMIEDKQIEAKNIYKLMLSAPKELKGMTFDKIGGGCMTFTPLDTLIKRLREIQDNIEALEDILREKKRNKVLIESILKKLDGIKHRVLYMRLVEGKKHREIAEELNYNEDYIRQICSRHMASNE